MAVGIAAATPWSATSSTLAGFTATVTNTPDSAAINMWFDCTNPTKPQGAWDGTRTDDWAVYPMSVALANPVADTSGSAHNATYSGGVAYSATGGPCVDHPGYYTYTSSSKGYLTDTTNTYSSSTYSGLGSQVVWFRTSTANGAPLISLETDKTDPNGNYSSGYPSKGRTLFIGTNGTLNFATWNSTLGDTLIGSTASVTDNAWHMAATVVDTTGIYLYLDGKLVDSTTTMTSTTIQSISGYWHYGGGEMGGWNTYKGSTTKLNNGWLYFNGAMSMSGIYTKAMTPTQIWDMYQAAKITA